MSIVEETFLAIRHYGDAIKLVRRHKMFPLLFVSFFLFLLILAVCGFGIYSGNNALIEWIMNLSWVQRWNSFFEDAPWVITIFKFGINIATFFLFISFYKFVFLALASPLYAYISEKGAEKYKGVTYPFVWSQFIKDIIRGIRISIRNLFKQLLLTLLLFILSFIPVIGFIFAFLILMLDAYYYGFAMLDYCNERDKKTMRQSIDWIKSHRGLALGNGLIFYASMILLPVVGVIFIAPISAIAAMISYFQITEKST
jgi:CysZ protein